MMELDAAVMGLDAINGGQCHSRGATLILMFASLVQWPSRQVEVGTMAAVTKKNCSLLIISSFRLGFFLDRKDNL